MEWDFKWPSLQPKRCKMNISWFIHTFRVTPRVIKTAENHIYVQSWRKTFYLAVKDNYCVEAMFVLYFPKKTPKRRRENPRRQEYLLVMFLRQFTKVFKRRIRRIYWIRPTRHHELLYILSYFIFLPSIAMVTCLAPFYLATDAVTKYHELMDITTEKNNARMCEQVRSTQLGESNFNLFLV